MHTSCPSYTRVGWEFGRSDPLLVDHTHCCRNNSATVQRALATTPRPGQPLEIGVWVDAGLVESFSSGVAITSLVHATTDAGGPSEARRSTVSVSAQGVSCVVSSYKLSMNATA